jgi:hypothetical protein
MTKKPRIRLMRGFGALFRWECRGEHPDAPGSLPTIGWGVTPQRAYQDWLTYWEIPF